WTESSPYWQVALGYALVGVGVGFAGTPASHSLTGSVPVKRVGMASGTADLQRDLGGAIMQSIFGALLTAGYASAVASAIASAPSSEQDLVTNNVEAQLQKSMAGADAVAAQYPKYSADIIASAKSAFLDGADWAYLAGVLAIVIGGVLVFFLFPKRQRELTLLQQYRDHDEG
ncbi:MAG: MFS transporter, partial [Candidatus Nanopelagicales bacterium]